MKDHGYFNEYADSFWQWEENNEVISVRNGPTIIYTKQLSKIIRALDHSGTPQFGSLLLAIIATNPEGAQILDSIRSRFYSSGNERFLDSVNSAFAFLKILTQIPEPYKKEPLRPTLFHNIFHNCHSKISPLRAQYLGDFLDIEDKTKVQLNSTRHTKEIRTISLLYAKFPTPEKVIDFMTGLPNTEKVRDILGPLPNISLKQVPEKNYIDDLISNPQTFHTGSLVKYLWSGLNITLHSTVPSAQPLGGISDLTNKGSLDKILLSEFANDDLVFMSRLANNEALYIQREIPPEQNESERIILIDTSLKMWGTPKVISYAIMLAIAKHPKTDIACRAFAVGVTHTEIAFETINEIIRSLQFVSGTLSAIEGIESYFEKFPDHKNREIILITEESSARESKMIKILNEHQTSISYLIFVDSEGNIKVQKRQKSGNKILQKISLPLDELWKNPPKANKAPDREIPNAIPIFVRNSPDPLATLYFPPEDALYQITINGNILRSSHPSHRKSRNEPSSEKINASPDNQPSQDKTLGMGWEPLFPSLVIKGTSFEIGENSMSEPLLLSLNKTSPAFTITNLKTGKRTHSHISDFDRYLNCEMIFLNGLFYIRKHTLYWQMSTDGDLRSVSKMNEKMFTERALTKFQTNQLNYGGKSIQKKIHLVAITHEDELLVNGHILEFQLDFTLAKFIKKTKQQSAIQAVKHSDSTYIFTDGSSVQFMSIGLLKLISSDPNISPVYIPTVIDTPLGMHAESFFSGFNYFLNTNRASDKLIILKSFKEQFIDPFIKRIRDFQY